MFDPSLLQINVLFHKTHQHLSMSNASLLLLIYDLVGLAVANTGKADGAASLQAPCHHCTRDRVARF